MTQNQRGQRERILCPLPRCWRMVHTSPGFIVEITNQVIGAGESCAPQALVQGKQAVVFVTIPTIF